MSKVTKEDVNKAAKEYMEAKIKVETIIEKPPLIAKSEIGFALEETDKLHRKWHDLTNAYVAQR